MLRLFWAAVCCLLFSGQVSAVVNEKQGSDSANARVQGPGIVTPASVVVVHGVRDSLEIDKLKEEVKGLKKTNKALSKTSRRWVAWLGALGGLLTVVLGAILGFLLNRGQGRRLEYDHRRSREEHLLLLTKGLGSKSPQHRAAAVSMLVRRLTLNQSSKGPGSSENATIVSLLVNVTKYEEKEQLQKFIADGIAKGMNAIHDIDREMDKVKLPQRSPLLSFDFQGAKLNEAWWKRIDARGVDFYEAELDKAGLREAFLGSAVLKGASLKEAVLISADLRGAKLNEADLSGADLSRADLRGADLTGAVVGAGTLFVGATYDTNTKFPDGFVPLSKGMIHQATPWIPPKV